MIHPTAAEMLAEIDRRIAEDREHTAGALRGLALVRLDGQRFDPFITVTIEDDEHD